jgi:hypothetical protein
VGDGGFEGGVEYNSFSSGGDGVGSRVDEDGGGERVRKGVRKGGWRGLARVDSC